MVFHWSLSDSKYYYYYYFSLLHTSQQIIFTTQSCLFYYLYVYIRCLVAIAGFYLTANSPKSQALSSESCYTLQVFHTSFWGGGWGQSVSKSPWVARIPLADSSSAWFRMVSILLLIFSSLSIFSWFLGIVIKAITEIGIFVTFMLHK